MTITSGQSFTIRFSRREPIVAGRIYENLAHLRVILRQDFGSKHSVQ
jgi:hypothetical protein